MLSIHELVKQTKELVEEERKVTSQIIEHLAEINDRLICFEYRYGSLQEFCERELGYSPGAAARRIAAMRLVTKVPETQRMLERGSMSLETMQMVQIHSRKEDLTAEQVKAVIVQVEGKSKREAERIIRPEKSYAIQLTEAEYEKLQELKARVGTSSIDKILNEALKRISPAKCAPLSESKSYQAPKSIRQELHKKPVCAWVGCLETENLQVDHITEWSEGGKTELSNLRLLCPGHNKLHSFEKVSAYLRTDDAAIGDRVTPRTRSRSGRPDRARR